jgi:hypothetical protein
MRSGEVISLKFLMNEVRFVHLTEASALGRLCFESKAGANWPLNLLSFP